MLYINTSYIICYISVKYSYINFHRVMRSIDCRLTGIVSSLIAIKKPMISLQASLLSVIALLFTIQLLMIVID